MITHQHPVLCTLYGEYHVRLDCIPFNSSLKPAALSLLLVNVTEGIVVAGITKQRRSL